MAVTQAHPVANAPPGHPHTTGGSLASAMPAMPASSPQKKFSTLSAFSHRGGAGPNGTADTASPTDGSKPSRTGLKGLFDGTSSGLPPVAAASSSASAVTLGTAASATTAPGVSPLADRTRTGSSNNNRWLSPSSPPGAQAGREDGPWSISVAEAPSRPLTGGDGGKRDARKKSKATSPPMYTLYVTTPTHNLTLLRSSNDIVELDARIRDGQSAANTYPTFPPLSTGASVQTSRKILQTISRTLSPGGNRSRTALSNLTGAGMNSTDGSPSLGASSASASSTPPPPLTPTKAQPSVPQSPSEKSATATHTATTTQLATYFTTIANLPVVKKHKAWKRFTRVGTDDLESVRVERRVRKVRSDLAQHVKSSVAPANTNVAGMTSQSDIGEDSGRTDDDKSFSGRSTSHSYRQDDGLSRAASVDTDRSGRSGGVASSGLVMSDERDLASRKGPNFAGIPEEMERGASTDGGAEARSTGAQNSSSQHGSRSHPSQSKRRERRGRRHTDQDKVTVDDFDMIRVLGKGCAGKVLLVRHRPTKGLFAMKSIHKRHVLAHQELQHTLTEQAVLKRMARDVMDPFVVKLWWSFHDPSNLYLVMDFHPGGDLATQLSRWGRLGRDRARFYAAEIVEGVEGLHRAGVIYRDLKPENVLIGVDGHIVLSDFGLSKEFPVRTLGTDANGSSTPPPGSLSRGPSSKDGMRRSSGGHETSSHWGSASEVIDHGGRRASSGNTSDGVTPGSVKRNRWADERDVTTTFCGTAEYLAPEVIQGAAYSYEVDWWSFGTMLYEMLTGITPFWADTHADMYVRVLHDELVFPDDRVLDQDTKSILRGLLQRNPMLRMKEPRIKRHPYFSMIEWDHVFHKRYIPPYIPPTNPLDDTDTQNFDETFLDMKPVINGADDEDVDDEDGNAGTAEAAGASANGQKTAQDQTGSKDVDEAMAHRTASDGKSLFDGYSFRGRRDSESVHSTNFSASGPSEDGLEAMAGTSSTGKTVAAVTSPPLRPAALPATKKRGEDNEEEEDDSAARAAVAALDHLEREAALSEAALSSASPMSTSTHPTSVRDSDEAESHVSATTATATSGGTPAARPRGTHKVAMGGLLPTETITEEGREEVEDDDWDMVDAPTGAELIMSETNGGKGQNLFARGVVDTYRLLRRQESSRAPSTSPYTTTKPFNRLTRRNRSSTRELKTKKSNVSNDASAATPSAAAAGILRNGSAISLAGRSVGGGEGPQSEDGSHTPNNARATERDGRLVPPSSTSVNLGNAGNDGALERKVASPSLASSEELAQQERAKQRLKKMKRFTNFFETGNR